MAGGIISAGGLGLMMFVNDISQVYLTYGLMTGKMSLNIIELVHEKTNKLGSDQVLHKSGCKVTEAS